MYEIVLKEVEPQRVASIRGIIPDYQSVTPLLDELYDYLHEFDAQGLKAAVWHEAEFKEKDVDCEALVFLNQPVRESDRVTTYELPSMTVAAVEHRGAYQTLPQAYGAIMQWIQANEYDIVGPGRELYHLLTPPIRQDDESYVTEIQFPVRKK